MPHSGSIGNQAKSGIYFLSVTKGQHRYRLTRSALVLSYLAVGLGATSVGIRYAPEVPGGPHSHVMQVEGETPSLLIHRVSQRDPATDQKPPLLQRVKQHLLSPFVIFRKRGMGENPTLRIILYILSIILILGLQYAVGFLACSLACSGYGLYSILVLIGGALVGGFLLSLVYEWAFQVKEKRERWRSRLQHISVFALGFLVTILLTMIDPPTSLAALILGIGMILLFAGIVRSRSRRRRKQAEEENGLKSGPLSTVRLQPPSAPPVGEQ